MRLISRLLVCLAVLAVLVNVSTAPCYAMRQGPTRTALPTDSAITVYVGAQATWQSLVNEAAPTVTSDMGADVSAYLLSDTPTVESLSAHSLVQGPLPISSDWYAYRPTTDTYRLTFDITDSSHRLGRIVVSDLVTGQVPGSLAAAADGAALQGQLAIAWTQPYYRVDGYDLFTATSAATGDGRFSAVYTPATGPAPGDYDIELSPLYQGQGNTSTTTRPILRGLLQDETLRLNP